MLILDCFSVKAEGLLAVGCMICQLCPMMPEPWKCAGGCLRLLSELSGSASPLRISTPVLPVEVHSPSSISERVTTALCISYKEKKVQYNLKVFWKLLQIKKLGQLGGLK